MTENLNIILGSKNRKLSRGILYPNKEIFLLNKWIYLIMAYINDKYVKTEFESGEK